MTDFLSNLFDTSDYPARWYCGNWSSLEGWLHIVSDIAIFAAYFAIPTTLVFFARRRPDFPFRRIFWLFAAFILFCGTTHLAEATIFWVPIYRISGLLKLGTAIVSWATVVILVRNLPVLLELPSIAQMNMQLKSEVAERQAYAEKLEEAKAEAHRANLAKSAFLANMSHEIRTPMSAILGYADVLLGQLDPPEQRNNVMTIQRNGNHLLELINDILDLSRIEAGKLEIEMEPTSLGLLLCDVDSLLRVRANEKRLNLVIRSEGLLPESIQTDVTRVRQVLVNLLGNAIKFTRQGRVELVAKFVAGSTPMIQFDVVDTGIGISPQQQLVLFRPFSQGGTAITREFGGSGLGLAISHRIVQLLHGRMELESELGRGTIVRVWIPTGPIETVAMIQPQLDVIAEQRSTDAETLPTLSGRILVVDDRRDVLFISEHFLKTAGADVTTAINGQQGIEACVEARDTGQPFDLIVMDMQMPVMDGRDATLQMRSLGFDQPIIALTADAMKGDRDRCLVAGCDDYLSKPLNRKQFLEMVSHYLNDWTADRLKQRRRERIDRLKKQLEQVSFADSVELN